MMPTEETVSRSITTPIREGLTVSELYDGEDRGLIGCWERGRAKAESDPELSESALAGELPILNWKRGTLQYLAYWQGLRGEDLSIDFSALVVLTCSSLQRSYCFGVGSERDKRQNQLDQEFLK